MSSKSRKESARLASVTRSLIYLTGDKFQYGIGIYAQAIHFAMKVVGASSYSGNPRTFIKNNLDLLEQYVKDNSKKLAEIKNGRKTERSSIKLGRTIATKPKKQTVAGVDVASTAFLSTFEWRKLRMEALKKYGPKCMCCGATPATGAVMNVDHIKPRKDWPSLALEISNLQILCHECNHGKGNWDSTDWRK